MRIMKKYIYISIVSLFLMNCKAQNILPVQSLPTYTKITENDYIKDTNGLLNPYVGTWVDTNGVDTLKFVIRKAVNNYNGYYHEDILYGEYQYIKNGVELINTLSKIDTVYQAQANHSISGNEIINKHDLRLPCPDCNETEKRLYGIMSDNIKKVTADLFMRRIIVNGQSALSILIHFDGIINTANGTEFVGSTVPNGRYTLIKQP
jgi:hypothetical protein